MQSKQSFTNELIDKVDPIAHGELSGQISNGKPFMFRNELHGGLQVQRSGDVVRGEFYQGFVGIGSNSAEEARSTAHYGFNGQA